ncbi:S ribonuclease [Pyrus ussuriensis x Pyrus communis]|uniref:S ribonuclease n=1 Tax=Pyrus ussuriensis x Pyrus communis TaxID=2448454 RepID=A0A5N5FK45_9ROSA|nr:S ribonuclease [Pyrus ussuriensis x Pyrus communis]KAB2623345.1 S ribonuclease [Pyrus ussuriensis x Pyrus communis]
MHACSLFSSAVSDGFFRAKTVESEVDLTSTPCKTCLDSGDDASDGQCRSLLDITPVRGTGDDKCDPYLPNHDGMFASDGDHAVALVGTWQRMQDLRPIFRFFGVQNYVVLSVCANSMSKWYV